MVTKVTMVQYTDYAIEPANALHDPRALHVADDVPPPAPSRPDSESTVRTQASSWRT